MFFILKKGRKRAVILENQFRHYVIHACSISTFSSLMKTTIALDSKKNYLLERELDVFTHLDSVRHQIPG